MHLPRPHIIEFDVKDLAECNLVASDLYEMIEREHGPIIAQRIFSNVTPTKRRLAFNKNVDLMIAFRKHDRAARRKSRLDSCRAPESADTSECKGRLR